MTDTAERLKWELERLSTRERAELARFLLHSLEDGADADAPAVWEAELVRRAEEILAGDAGGERAEETLAQLRAKYS
jgi:hypothetical protein